MSDPLRIAVLLKQVPLLESAEQLLTIGPDGRLVRDGVALEINPYCRRAISKGIELATQTDGTCVAFSLGPPSAEDALREAVAAGATFAVHVTDPAFAGSDTLATARALVCALELEGPFDLVLTGLASVDADTGQVGPEIAELLGLPFVSGVRELSLDGDKVELECERDNGLIRASTTLPCVLSVAERLTFPARATPEERASVAPNAIKILTSSDLHGGPWGLEGSPTTVGEVRILEQVRNRQILSGSLEDQLAELVGSLRTRGVLERIPQVPNEGSESSNGAGNSPDSTRPLVLVAMEPSRLRLGREILSGATALAAALDGTVLAVAVGDDATSATLDSYGVEELVFLATTDGLTLAPEDVAAALTDICIERGPAILLAPSTSWGREVAARVAAALGAGLTGDASSLEIHNGRLVAWKPAFGGQLEAAISATTPLQCATVRPGALRISLRRTRTSHQTTRAVKPRERVTYRDERVDSSADALATARTLIGVGAGVEPDRYDELAPLVTLLDAELVGTRKVADSGWLPRTRQVGLTGQHLAPRLYIAIGIAGRMNHMVGLRRAGTIVAINSDPASQIFQSADFGLVGDWRDVVPAFVEALTANP